MNPIFRSRRFFIINGLIMLLVAGGLCVTACTDSLAGPPWRWGGCFSGWAFEGREAQEGPTALAGTWYLFPRRAKGLHGCYEAEGTTHQPVDGSFWMNAPEEEKVIISGLYNRYCIRCHGVDGRGVWDIPGVPDFTNVRWQATRSDHQIARIVIEGRGAVMPPFRGTLSLEEAFGMARYLRSFVPGTEVSRPDLKTPPKIDTKAK